MYEFIHLNFVLSRGFIICNWPDLTQILGKSRCVLIAEFPHSFCLFFPSLFSLPDPPMITDMKNMPAHLGKTAILRCEAMAVPPAAFEWYRDDHR